MHGGKAPQVAAAARRRAAKSRAEGAVGRLLADLGRGDEAHPVDALLEELDHAGLMLRAIRLQMSSLDALHGPDHLGDEEPDVLVALNGDWSDRRARIAKTLLDADVDQRRLRLDALRQERVMDGLVAAMSDVLERRGMLDALADFKRELGVALQHRLALPPGGGG